MKRRIIDVWHVLADVLLGAPCAGICMMVVYIIDSIRIYIHTWDDKNYPLYINDFMDGIKLGYQYRKDITGANYED